MRMFWVTLLACITLAGCNTIAGIGEDITGVARWSQGGISGGGY
ncbi:MULTISPECIES: hypothetical protein [Paracoccus]|nr:MULTISPECIES: hypothetical protein [Paracoccus]